jgi:hypothetical protein
MTRQKHDVIVAVVHDHHRGWQSVSLHVKGMDRSEREGLREPLTDDMISSGFDQRFTANAAADWNVRSFELRVEEANLQVTRGARVPGCGYFQLFPSKI